ncbi:hypothetical protein ACI782_12535 [Geodermatophilus sp. SYSU D00703]
MARLAVRPGPHPRWRACAHLAVVVVLRLSGKRTPATLNAFDLVVTVALGSTLAAILLSGDVSWREGARQDVGGTVRRDVQAGRVPARAATTRLGDAEGDGEADPDHRERPQRAAQARRDRGEHPGRASRRGRCVPDRGPGRWLVV